MFLSRIDILFAILSSFYSVSFSFSRIDELKAKLADQIELSRMYMQSNNELVMNVANLQQKIQEQEKAANKIYSINQRYLSFSTFIFPLPSFYIFFIGINNIDSILLGKLWNTKRRYSRWNKLWLQQNIICWNPRRRSINSGKIELPSIMILLICIKCMQSK